MGGTHPPGGTLAEEREGKATFVVGDIRGKTIKNLASSVTTRSFLPKLNQPFLLPNLLSRP
jgi:hypothetical protein